MAAESIKVDYTVQTTVTQVLSDTDAPAASGGGATVRHDQWNVSTEFNASSATDPVSKCAVFNQALTASAATIDLTALTGTKGAAVNLTGLKVQLARFINPTTNANSITITVGASNGYLLGGAGWKWILAPGQEITFRGYDQAPDVGASAKTIDLSGTGSQVLRCMIVAG